MVDDLKNALEIAKQIAEKEYHVRKEMLFIFQNESDCSDFVSTIYHPEHYACMIHPIEINGSYLCGTCTPIESDVEQIHSLIKIYNDIAADYQGKFYSFRFRVWLGSTEAYENKYSDWLSLTSPNKSLKSDAASGAA